ncbi:MAG: copper homeostasis protein CutC [Gemmataceae bacterium]
MSQAQAHVPLAARVPSSHPDDTPYQHPRNQLSLEVCCETVEDVIAAQAGGADRIELCTALDLGGLTPSLGLLLAVRSVTRLPIWVMIRPRQGDFVYTPDEVTVMARDIELCLGATPAGFVFGVLNPDGRVNSDACRVLIERCAGLPVVFHRAFDRTPSLAEAMAAVVELGFRRILTSGREPTATQGAKAIRLVRQHAGERIEVLPCGRVRADNLQYLLDITGCDQVHGSFSEPIPEGETEGYRGYGPRTRVSRTVVAAARAELDRLSSLTVPN